MKEYLVFSPHVFLWFDRQSGFFYNSKETTSLKFCCDELIYGYCTRINDPINLYSVSINPDDKTNLSFLSWIMNIEKHKIGILHSVEDTTKKPFSFPPIINLRNEIEESQVSDKKHYSTVNFAECLNEISFFLGGVELPNNEKEYFKQILYPISQKYFLSYNELHTFLAISNVTHLCQINIICSDLFSYPNFENLLRLLNAYNISTTFYIDGYNVNIANRELNIFRGEKTNVKLYFKDVDNFIKIQDCIKTYDIKYNWVFLIKNETDLLVCEKIVNEYDLNQTDVWPVLTGSNISFFQENVFTSPDEIDNASITKQNIFCNQILNSNYWGNLFILPNGNVYGNLNNKILGTMKDDAMDLIKLELNSPESSWKCTREKVFPCKDCIYRNICPPPSNYEFYLNKFNLCVINR